jgi:hypothetical protein
VENEDQQKIQKGSAIDIQIADEDGWVQQENPVASERIPQQLEEGLDEIQIVSMNRFVEGKARRKNSIEDRPSTKRSDFVRCTINKFHKLDNVNQNINNFMSRSKGTMSSEDPNYTLRSLRRDNYSGGGADFIDIQNLGSDSQI